VLASLILLLFRVVLTQRTWLFFCSAINFCCSIAEYEGRDIPCADSTSVTDNFGTTCPLPGEDVVTSIGIHGITTDFWFNIGMVIALQFLFRIGAYILLRRTR
jgi:hypothetical protein